MRQNATLITVACGILSCVAISAMASTIPQDEMLGIDTTIPGGLETTREEFPPRRSPLRTMQQVHDFLSNSTTLKSIKLRVTLLGCSSHPDRYNFPFDFPAGSRYSFKLESLQLDGYDFGYQEWNRVQPPSKLFPSYPHSWAPDGIGNYFWWYMSDLATRYYKWRDLPDDQKHKTNLDQWIEAMDFSHIRELALRDIRGQSVVVIRLPPLLKSLTSLTIRGVHHVREFVLGLPRDSLEHLSWISGCGCRQSHFVLDVVGHHARSLARLELREPESSYHQREVLTAEELASLGDLAPNLQELTIDLNRNGTWPVEELQSVAKHYPRLKRLTIYLELASEQRRQHESSAWPRRSTWASDEGEDLDNMARPLLNKTTGMELFELLRKQKVGEELVQLKLFAGDWERSHDGPLYTAAWLEHRKAWVTCQVLESSNNSGKQILCDGRDTVVVNGNDSVWDEMDLVPRGVIIPVLDEDEEEQLRLLEMDVAHED
ncbi:hypothetical protein CCHR01_11667 [Colletotrichum chrysophilum]|uniref:F-box domain-containing protein n=1 Tax=Colletotrichum chrysophilum TaxID=1836956 RepID=A0AAD9ACM7_9PEZI|nr:hypothetical protein CCHR01_11667 [Colletotrichum chrysophilum]